MNSKFQMLKLKYLLSPLIMIVFFACENRDWKNPYDPNASKDDWAPKNLQIHQISVKKVRLIWEQYDLRIDGFKIDKKIINDQWKIDYVSINNKNTREWIDTSVVLNSPHYYRLYAYAGGSKSSFIEKTINPIIPAPSNLKIKQLSDIEVQLNWQDNSNGEEGFKIDKKVGSGSWEIVYSMVGSNTEEWIDTDPVLDNTNYYRVYGYSCDSKSSTINDDIIPIFPAPTNLNITVISASEVQLTWDAHPFDNILGYKIDRKINNGDFEEKHITKEKNYNDTDLFKNNFYTYRVKAYTEINTSDASNTKKIKWLVSSYSLLWTGEHSAGVNSVNFSQDNSKVVSGSYDNTLKVWDAETGDLIWTGYHSYDVYSVNFSPDNFKVVSGSGWYIDEGEVKVWDAGTGNLLWTVEHLGIVESVNFSPDNFKVVSGSGWYSEGEVKVWDAGTGTLLWTGYHSDNVNSVNFSPDNSKVVSGSDDNTLKVWDAETGDLIWTGYHSYDVYSVNFSPDNSKVVSGSDDNTLKVWDAGTGNLLWTGEHSGDVNSVNFSQDNSKVVSGSYDNTVKVWDAETGDLIWTGEHSYRVRSVNFSPDNSKVVSGSWGKVKVWNAETGNLLWTVEHLGIVKSVNFSPDNSKVVSGSNDNTLKVWDAEEYSWFVTDGE